ncbi:MAG: helix-turn-helix domain-containing protein [Niabella sp.]
MKEPAHYPPSKELTNYICSYGILESPEHIDDPYFSPPIALSGFIITTINSRGIFHAKIGDRNHYSSQAVATGQITEPVHGISIGHQRILLIFFRPTGMHELFGNDMSKITDSSMPLEALIGADKTKILLQNLTKHQTDDYQIDCLNTFFEKYITTSSKTICNLKRILDYIHQKKGEMDITELEKYGYCQRKTLERHFSKIIGLSPKKYCQIYQFKCLIQLIHERPKMTWSELALQAGYYDLSHMSRYIKEYLRVTPNNMVHLDMNFINYLLSR